MQSEPLRLALDWEPNVNHCGFLFAESRGYYKEADVKVEFVRPDHEDYAEGPAHMVAQKSATFGITTSEALVKIRLETKAPIVAVAALMQKDLSVFVTHGNSGIDRPGLLDNKTYASTRGPYEDKIVEQMIRNDGGDGCVWEMHEKPLQLWPAFVEKKADFIWIYDNWHGVEAEVKHLPLHKWRPSQFAIPYGYAPILIAHKDVIEKHRDAITKFLAATARGYQDCFHDPEAAAPKIATAFGKGAHRDPGFVREALKRMAHDGALRPDGKWGVMDCQRWADWMEWLETHTPARRIGRPEDLFTNELLPT